MLTAFLAEVKKVTSDQLVMMKLLSEVLYKQLQYIKHIHGYSSEATQNDPASRSKKQVT
jgi:hypothetical protein